MTIIITYDMEYGCDTHIAETEIWLNYTLVMKRTSALELMYEASMVVTI
jgi:hypothetical protein